MVYALLCGEGGDRIALEVLWKDDDDEACAASQGAVTSGGGGGLSVVGLGCIDLLKQACSLLLEKPRQAVVVGVPPGSGDHGVCGCGKELAKLKRERGRLMAALRQGGAGQGGGGGEGGRGDGLGLMRLNRRLVLQVEMAEEGLKEGGLVVDASQAAMVRQPSS